MLGYCGAVLCLFLTPLPLGLQSLTAVMVLAGMRRAWLSQPALGGAPLALTWDRESRWFLAEHGKETECTLCPDSYWHPALAILLLRRHGRRVRAVILFSDSVDPETFRLLKIRLRLERYSLGSEAASVAGRVLAPWFERPRDRG